MQELYFDLRIYTLEAIKRGLYFQCPTAFLEMTESQKVVIRTKDMIDEKLFLSKLLDMQLQIDLEKKFYKIRNMLVAQALEPYQNIDDLLVQDENE